MVLSEKEAPALRRSEQKSIYIVYMNFRNR